MIHFHGKVPGQSAIFKAAMEVQRAKHGPQIRRDIAQMRKCKWDRRVAKGRIIGMYERMLAIPYIVEIFIEAWPEFKPRLTAADFLMLRKMRIAL